MDTPALKRQRSSDEPSENAREKGPCVLVLLQEENRGDQSFYVIPMKEIKDELMDMIFKMADKAYHYDEDDDDDEEDSEDDESVLEEKEAQKEWLREEKEDIKTELDRYFSDIFEEKYKEYRIKQVGTSFFEKAPQRIAHIAFIQLDDLRM